MKKFFALFLVICFTLFSVSIAENKKIDLSNYSIEELIALQSEIAGELLNRGTEKQATVPMGTFVIGKDIPAGTYSISPANENGFILVVFPDENTTGEYDWIYHEYISPNEYIGKMELLEGQVITLDGFAIFKVYSGISFF